MVKKTIKFDIYIKTSEQTPTYSYTAKQKVMSNDKDSTQITFNLLDVAPEELSGSSASILLYMEDGSFFQKSDVTINRNSVIYTMKPEETRHSGNTKVQIVLNKGTVQTASLIYNFEIERGLEKFPIVEKEIQDWTSLTAEAKAFVEQIKDFTLEGFVENKMGEELSNLETNYATRLTGLEQKDNQLTAQLAHTTQESLTLWEDIAEFGSGTVIWKQSIQNRQTINISEFFRKLHRSTEEVSISCYGDSLTYGYDVVSANKRPPHPAVWEFGGTNETTRASVTYPETLQNRLRDVYGSRVTVINRGISGSTAESIYGYWTANSNADLTIFMIGTNDMSQKSLTNYVKWLERNIIREILWGGSVILMTPIKNRFSGVTGNLEIFRNIMNYFGHIYGLPVIDGQEILRNYNASIFSESTHLNGKGYEILGTKVAATLLNKPLLKPFKIAHGSKVLTRAELDPITYLGTSKQNMLATYGDTPGEDYVNGNVLASIPAGQSVIFNFYSESEDLVLIPSFDSLGATTLTFDLDYLVEQPTPALASAIYRSEVSTDVVIPNSFAITNNSTVKFNKNSIQDITDTRYLHVVGKGWHTLKVTCTTGEVYLSGLEVLSYDNFYRYFIGQPYRFKTHATFTDTSIASSNSINITTLEKKLGMQLTDIFREGRLLKLSITNWNQATKHYLIYVDGDTAVLGTTPLATINLTASPTVIRTLESVTYDKPSKNITFNWGGTLTRQSLIEISRF